MMVKHTTRAELEDIDLVRVVCAKCDSATEMVCNKLVAFAANPQCPVCNAFFYTDEQSFAKAVKLFAEGVAALRALSNLVRIEFAIQDDDEE